MTTPAHLVDGEHDPDNLPPTLTQVTVVVDTTIAETLAALGPGAIITSAFIRNDSRRAVVIGEDDEDELRAGLA